MKSNSETGSKVRLGIFISVAIALFIAVIYFIGNRQHLFSRTINVNGVFKDLGGLQEGNNVRFTGINVGSIASIEILTDSTVKVDMMIEKRVQKFIKTDAIATIGSEGLMGNKVINLMAGGNNSPMIEDGGTLKTVTPVSLDDIMRNLEVTSKNAANITDDISVLTGSIRNGEGAVGKILSDSSFAENLDQTMKNAKNATAGLNENMEAAKHNFLLKGYFKKKEKEAEKKKEEAEKAKKEGEKK
jgi:phospholipid/cholesterol/gamma-HCH transport system substrate-binding protein